MALGSTLHVFEIELADADRGVYLPLELRVARHPSEAEDHLLARVLAYCFEHTEGIEFSNGLSSPDDPAIAVRDLTGRLTTWIDIGAPEAARLHRAAKAASRVVVYTHKDPQALAARLGRERIHRSEALELYALDPTWLAAIAARLERRMAFALTISAGHVYLSMGTDTHPSVIEKIEFVPR